MKKLFLTYVTLFSIVIASNLQADEKIFEGGISATTGPVNGGGITIGGIDYFNNRKFGIQAHLGAGAGAKSGAEKSQLAAMMEVSGLVRVLGENRSSNLYATGGLETIIMSDVSARSATSAKIGTAMVADKFKLEAGVLKNLDTSNVIDGMYFKMTQGY